MNGILLIKSERLLSRGRKEQEKDERREKWREIFYRPLINPVGNISMHLGGVGRVVRSAKWPNDSGS